MEEFAENTFTQVIFYSELNGSGIGHSKKLS